MNKPILSILIPTYKRFQKLKVLLITLYPFLLQRGQYVELLIGNDNPQDFNQINKFIKKYSENICSRVEVLECKENRGLYANRVNLISASTGEFIVFVDDDDFLNTTELDKFIDPITVNSSLIFEYDHDAWIFNTIEFYHNLKDGSNQITDKFRKAKEKSGKAFAGIAGSIFKRSSIARNLDSYVNYLASMDLSKNIGEDHVFFNYFKNIAKAINSIKVINKPLYIANYDKANEHMMLTNMKENTVENLNKIRNYVDVSKI